MESSGALERLHVAARLLTRVHQQLSAEARSEPIESYAGEWFLDNYYLVRAAVRQVEQDLPAALYRKLPADAGAPDAAPHVYGLATRLVAESSARLDLEWVEAQVREYQSARVLSMGELWALPAMLRLVVVERLAESMSRIAQGERSAHGAKSVPGQAAERGAARQRAPVAASDDEQVANCVVSLRALRHQDWRIFFERLSLVERVLRAEPTGVYRRMDFPTRDRYRKAVERLAASADRPEAEVASAAVDLARDHVAGAAAEASAAKSGTATSHAATRRAHVGYYLVGPGVGLLMQRVGYRQPALERLGAALLRRPSLVYLGAVGLLTLLLLAAGERHAAWGGAGVWQQLLVLLVLFIPA
ncbi:MAG: hypothetical protein WDA15_10395, partial [Trueperaceae bacterium]